MRRAVVLALALAVGWLALAQVQIKPDPFTETTTVTVQPRPNGGAPMFRALAIREMVDATPEAPLIVLSFASVSYDGWRYLDCHPLYVLADGAPVELGDAEHKGVVEEGYVIEFVSVRVNLPTLSKLANARAVTFKLCNDVLPLNATDMQDLRDFLAALRPASPPDKYP